MARELGLFGQRGSAGEYVGQMDDRDPAYTRCRAVTEWTLLRLKKAYSFFFKKAPIITSPPSCPNPYALAVSADRIADTLTPPQATHRQRFNAILAAKCELYRQFHEITCIAFSRQEQGTAYGVESWNKLLAHHERLAKWYDTLPESLAQASSISPQAFLFQ